MESIRHLRHHPKTGVLQYRRVVPPDLRSILGKGSICASLGSKVLDHAALIRWVEIDRDARRRLDDARRKLCAGKTGQGDGQDPLPQFIDLRACAAAFQAWTEREVGRESARLYRLAARGLDDAGLLDFRHEVESMRNALNDSTPTNRVSVFDGKLDEALRAAGLSVPDDHVVRGALCPLFREAWGEVVAVLEGLLRVIGLPNDSLPLPSAEASAKSPASPAVAPLPPQPEGVRLSSLADAYLRHSDAAEDYASDVRMYVRRLRESLGEDRLVRDITKRDMIRFMGEISVLPARLTMAERSASLKELVARRDHPARPGGSRTPLSKRAIEKRMQCPGAMFRFGQLHELCSANPATGVRPIRKRTAEVPRQHFEEDEIARIFSSPLFTRHGGSVKSNLSVWTAWSQDSLFGSLLAR